MNDTGQRAGSRRLTDAQRLAWLRLIRTPNVGPASFRQLIGRFGSADIGIEQLPELMRASGTKNPPRIPTIAQAEAELQAAAKAGASFVAIGEPDYPFALATIDSPPPLLAVKGAPRVWSKSSVAIVGARNASIAGSKFAYRLANEIGLGGYTIASGLARGIDTAAHKGSLMSGTVAAVAGGIDRPYPPENGRLLEDIAANGGAVISEMPFGWEPRAQDFPRRNRLIAGLSMGLLVIEAAQRSGSLISARLAGEMGRLVFAVPGSPLDPRAEGSNGLLKNGAILVTNASDVLDQLEPMATRPVQRQSFLEPEAAYPDEPNQGDRQRVIDALGPTPVSIDDLLEHTGIHPALLQLILLEMDLDGRLERHSGGAVSRLDI